MRLILPFLLALLTAAAPLPAQETAKPASPAKPTGPARWEAEIAGIEKKLQAKKPAPGGIVFTGSSSIRLWDLDSAFPGLNAVNCGFGGSMIPDSTHFAPRIVLPLKPRLVVFYAGDNDSSNGHSAREIARDFEKFSATIHAALPECRILYIPIKPSIARKKLLNLQTKANGLIRKQCEADPARLEYVDLATPLLDKDGALRPELYRKDGLHLSPEGYQIWNKILLPRLKAP